LPIAIGGSPEASQLVNLSPARMALSEALAERRSALDQLEELHGPLSRLDRVLVAAQSVEAAGLRNEIDRLLTKPDAAKTGPANLNVLSALLPQGLVEAEQHLSKLAEGSADAERRLSIARDAYVRAAEFARVASTKVEEALWPAAVDAADADLRDLDQAIRRVLVIEGRLRSLVSALREVGHAGKPGGRGAFTAAESIEVKVVEVRRRPMLAIDAEIGRSFIDTLRSDPGAIF
jgi:hypothetical protein